MSDSTPRKRIGEILIDNHMLLPEQLDEALAKQKQSGRRLGQLLLDAGLISYEQLLGALAEQSGVPHVWLRKGLVDPDVVKLLPRAKAEAYTVIPMFKIAGTLTLAMVDTTSIFAIDDVESITKCKIQPVQCRGDDINKMIMEAYQDDLSGGSRVADISETRRAGSGDDELGVEGEGSEVINLINRMLKDAIKARASDLHIEADEKVTRIRLRVDGVLREVTSLSSSLHPAIVSRVKVMGRMDIAEKRLPQDGRIQVRLEGRPIDVRVSSMPTVDGEKIVMRILDQSKSMVHIDQIGFHSGALAQMKVLLQQPHGMILVTGPTGSGKTTTLYSGLSYINTVERNIVTIEDPVEYRMEMINQIQTNEDQGLDFARTLRSVLRQDPDVIMVGEIRDRETAEVAIQAALTGHLVLSTLHTNESAGTIIRMLEMGIESYLLTSAITGVVAQRLVRVVCPGCKHTIAPPEQFLRQIGWGGRKHGFVEGSGCDECGHSGYMGRSPILELLVMDDGLRELILQNATLQAIRNYCTTTSMETLRDEAYSLVEKGKTSLEEVMRVVYVEQADDAIVEGSNI